MRYTIRIENGNVAEEYMVGENGERLKTSEWMIENGRLVKKQHGGKFMANKKNRCNDEVTLDGEVYVKKSLVKPAKKRDKMTAVVAFVHHCGGYYGWTNDPTAVPLCLFDAQRVTSYVDNAPHIALHGDLKAPPASPIPGGSVLHDVACVFPCTDRAVTQIESYDPDDDYHNCH